jgi:hypothetical protein
MKNKYKKLTKDFNLDHQENDNNLTLNLPKCKNILCKIDIPINCTDEWFITLIDTKSNKTVFEEWTDYPEYSKRSIIIRWTNKDMKLIGKHKHNDIKKFIQQWIKANDIKIFHKTTKIFFNLIKINNKQCQLKIKNKWINLEMRS